MAVIVLRFVVNQALIEKQILTIMLKFESLKIFNMQLEIFRSMNYIYSITLLSVLLALPDMRQGTFFFVHSPALNFPA